MVLSTDPVHISLLRISVSWSLRTNRQCIGLTLQPPSSVRNRYCYSFPTLNGVFSVFRENYTKAQKAAPCPNSRRCRGGTGRPEDYFLRFPSVVRRSIQIEWCSDLDTYHAKYSVIVIVSTLLLQTWEAQHKRRSFHSSI